MPKITVQVSDKSLEFFSRLMKELKFKIVDDGKTAAADADLMIDAPGDAILPEKHGKGDKKHKDKKKKKKD
jgi:hypothetical protein